MMRQTNAFKPYQVRPKPGAIKHRSRRSGRFRFSAIIAALLGVNIYVFFIDGSPSVRDLLKSASVASKIPRKDATQKGSASTSKDRREPDVQALPDDTYVVRGSMKGQLGLAPALEKAGVDPSTIADLINALRSQLNFRALRPDQRFELWLDTRTHALRRFVFFLSSREKLLVERDKNGELRVERRAKHLTNKKVTLSGTIRSSLNQALIDAGGSAALVAQFVKLFSWDINWFTDPRKGDALKIVVLKQFLGDSFFGYGKILAAEYSGRAGRFQAFFLERNKDKGAYYNARGRSISRAFLKNPLSYTRISSRFNNKRFHPILHRTKGHYGVDYAAPTGTPIRAAADGTVSRANYSRGSGNMVILRHRGGIVTLYMHMNRFAQGIRRGVRVRQGQLIGYVGATGLATGPHLHYGIRKLGIGYVDPLRFKVPPGEMLPRSERDAFLAMVKIRQQELYSHRHDEQQIAADSRHAEREHPLN